MARIISFICVIFFSLSVIYAQQFDKMGVDTEALLNDQESYFLDSLLKDKVAQFNFEKKMVAFVYKNDDYQVSSKPLFFSEAKACCLKKEIPQCVVLVLNEKEVRKTAGHHAVIVLGQTDDINEKERKKILKQIKKKFEYEYY